MSFNSGSGMSGGLEDNISSYPHGNINISNNFSGVNNRNYNGGPFGAFRESQPQLSQVPTTIFIPSNSDSESKNHSTVGQPYSMTNDSLPRSPSMQLPRQNFQASGKQPNDPFNDIKSISQSPIGQIGLNYGSRLFEGTSALMGNQYNRSFSVLKYYFNVNNSYVINKLTLLLFPLKHKAWKRNTQHLAEGYVYLPPRDDINAPDLYVPLMAFISYVLMVGFVMGTAFKFTPEILGMTASRGIIVLMLEVISIKFGFYLLNTNAIPWLDVVAYCGYKFVGIIVSIIAGFVLGKYVYYGTTLLMSLFSAVFMVKTLKIVFSESSGGFGIGNQQKRNYFLFSIACFQLLLGYYLSHDITTVHH
jgi:hypothetical protein